MESKPWIYFLNTNSFFDSTDELIKNDSKLKDTLRIDLSFHFKSDGFVVENIEIQKINFRNEQKSGILNVSFVKVFFNSCLNIHEEERDFIDLKFELDSSKITIHSPTKFNREMDEI